MAETKAPEQAEQDQAEGKTTLGRALDVAGIVAGVFLGVIIFDVLSGGKVTRAVGRLMGRTKPCEDCADKQQAAPGEVSRDG